jgi:hypothetical protein
LQRTSRASTCLVTWLTRTCAELRSFSSRFLSR